MKYVVDTSIINKLVDGKIDPSELPTDGEFIASHIQIDELGKTKDAERRAQLLTRFGELGVEVVKTESAVWGRSKYGGAKWGGGITRRAIKAALDARNRRKKNNLDDAFIAEIAIKNGFTLLTADYDLNAVVESYDGQVQYWKRP
jgi:predicted nucleic acid-binding protein